MMKYNPLLFMQRPSIAIPFLCSLPVPAAIGHRLVLCLVLNKLLSSKSKSSSMYFPRLYLNFPEYALV